MSIRLRLAVVFAAAAALLFALGSWLFVAELSASLLGSIDAQLASPAQPGRPLSVRRAGVRRQAAGAQPGAGHRDGAGSPAPGEYVVQVIDPAGRVRGGSADAGNHAAAQPGPDSARPASQRIVADHVGRGRAGARDRPGRWPGTRAG